MPTSAAPHCKSSHAFNLHTATAEQTWKKVHCHRNSVDDGSSEFNGKRMGLRLSWTARPDDVVPERTWESITSSP